MMHSVGIDEAVQDTAHDAMGSKASAAKLAYFHDPYVQAMVRRSTKRAPLINRGYYTRVAVIRDIARDFVRKCRSDNLGCQIISFGGGFDTLFFTMKEENLAPNLYVEIDYKAVTQHKANLIRKLPILVDALTASLENIEGFPGSYKSGNEYCLLNVDFRDLAALKSNLEVAAVDFSSPTLFLSECVLIYVQPDYADALLQWTSDTFDGDRAFCIYEQILPDDPFGRTMCDNLKKRGCPLLSISSHPTLVSQEERFLSRGWALSHALDMNLIYETVLDRDDVRRIELLEMFDEFEEWHLIQAHYAVVVALSSPRFLIGVYAKFAAIAFRPNQLR